MFSSHGRKHSQRNAETAGEFVFNLVTFRAAHPDEPDGAEVDETISEPETAGLAMAPSRVDEAAARGALAGRARMQILPVRGARGLGWKDEPTTRS
jgi:hypothetical protein